MRTTAAAAGLVLGLVMACAGGQSDEGDPVQPTSGATSGGEMATGTGDSTGGGDDPSDDETASSGGEGETTFGCEQTWYPDADEDGHGDENYPVDGCLQPPGHIPQGGDCDDSNPDVHPGVEEVCDMADNDCDGLLDEASAMNTECQGCILGSMGTHAYYYCPQAMGQAEAGTFCMQWSASLLKLDDQAEQDFVLAEPLPVAPSFFIGLSDQAVEGTFVWSDGTAPSFTAWGMGEPNDALEGEDCVQLAVPAGTWNDIACTTAGAFICEAVGS